MKKSIFSLLVSVTGLALAGIIFIQFFWIRNVILLYQKQFGSKVHIAMKSAVNEMFESATDTSRYGLFRKQGITDPAELQLANINVKVLDSLIYSEFREIDLKTSFVYGIFKRDTQKLDFISDSTRKQELLNTEHLASLSCIFKHDSLVLGVWFPNEEQFALKNLYYWLASCFVLLIVLVVGFIVSVYSFLRQKKISEMKSDFINNITHELKTPIATISLASEMLTKPSVLQSEQKAKKYASIIYDENLRLKNQVEHVLQLATLERGKYVLRAEQFDLHELIRKISNSFQLITKTRNGQITTKLEAKEFLIYADRAHIEIILVNLIDNACKYSVREPRITISTFNKLDKICIIVEDQGLGISTENQKNIFQKFFRVHTGDLHNVKGFGLGLYNVKKFTEAHQGNVSVTSELGKGSRFEVVLPLKYKGTSAKNS